MYLNIKDTIFETDDYSVVTLQKPHIDREDGGHILIVLKNMDYIQFSRIPTNTAEKLAKIASIAGNAMERALVENGIDIGLINYQINGNWAVSSADPVPIHIHLYGRAKSSNRQKYGEALFLPLPSTGFYDCFTGINSSDIEKIRAYIAIDLASKEGL